jgi:hypothetical protein
MIAIAFFFVCALCDCFKPRRRLEAEILVLRHQLDVLQQCARLCLAAVDWPIALMMLETTWIAAITVIDVRLLGFTAARNI